MSFLFGGTSVTTAADKIASFQATTCDFGVAVPLLYGTSKVGPNLISYQNFTSKEQRTTTSSGKSESTQISYLYYVSVQLALGEGPIGGLGSVWVGDKKYSGLSSVNGSVEGGSSAWTTHLGNEANDQHGTLAYVEGNIFLGTNSASMPSYNFETKGMLRNLADGVDANPAHVIRDILRQLGITEERTDASNEKYWTNLDADSFARYESFCSNADLLISTPSDAFKEQKKAQEIIKELLTITNTYMYWSVDRFKFAPREPISYGDWQPNTTITYDITHDDLISDNGTPLKFKRKDTSEQYNFITVNFTNRANDYETESVSYQDTQNINSQGFKKTTIDAKWFHTKERAVKFANMAARKILTETNQYTLKLDWAFCRLEPGDLIRVTEPLIGIENKVMMVSEVTEQSNGVISVTAIERPEGEYSSALYTVRDDYNYQNFNIKPSNTSAPLFIIPPADLITSSNGLEIWVALHGVDAKWGGCQVYVSDKDGDYSYHGEQDVSSYYGKTLTAMNANTTSVTVKFSNPNTVQLLTGEQTPANGRTLIWINGECMSYTEATVADGVNTWQLTGLVRGQHGTTATAHAINSAMACLDSGIYRVPLTKHYKGKTIYFKFPAFNVLQANVQNVNDLDCYTCTANVSDMPNCESVTAYNKYRELADDVTRYDIVVEWTPPQGFEAYHQGQVWYKTTGLQSKDIGVVPAGVKASEIGFSKDWQYAGSGYNSLVIPQAVIGDTYKIAVCTEDLYGNVELPDSSTQIEIFVARKTELPNTPDGLSIQYGSDITVSWNDVRNADIKAYELRGSSAMVNGKPSGELIISTNSTICHPALSNRSGDLYLFAISAYDKYSSPAHISYNKSAPSKPNTPTLIAKLDGISITMANIPNDCYGIALQINGVTFNINSNTYYYPCAPGVYLVKYAFVDYFGIGTYSNEATITVSAYIPTSMIEDETIAYNKMSTEAKEAIGNASISNINIAVKGLLGNGSALTMKDGSLALVASNGEKLTGLFANEDGTMRLAGDYIHITGDTVFDNDVITKGMIKAGAIDADKLSATTITLTEQQGMQGGVVKLDANGLSCDVVNKDNNGNDIHSIVQFNSSGISFVDSNNNVFSNIARFKAGTCSNGEYVSLNWDVAPKTVLLFPWSVMTMIQGYATVNLYIVCEPSGITKDGFTANVYTALAAGSYNDVSAPSVSVSGPKRDERYGPYTEYTSYSTVSGITDNADEVSLSMNCYVSMDCDYQDSIVYSLYLNLEIYANDTLIYDEIHYSTSNVTRDNGWSFNVSANPTVSIPEGAAVKYRWRLKHRDEPHASGWTHVSYYVSSSAATGKARISKATKATGGDGTAHYLALG